MTTATGPISIASIAVGISAVGVLYALHHLRDQSRQRRVATLIFWPQSSGRQTARVLWSPRFNHLWTFLLLSGIATLLAAAMSAARWENASHDDSIHVVVVDIGTSMAAPAIDGRSLLQNAVDTARSDIDQMGKVPEVVAAGERPLVLSRGDEPAIVIEQQLGVLAPCSTASSSRLALEMAQSLIGTHAGHIVWYTDRDELPDGLPDAIAKRVIVRHQSPAPEAVSIVGVTYQTGSLRVTLAGHSKTPMLLQATSADGSSQRQTITCTGNQTCCSIDGLTADGTIVSLALQYAPGSPLEHQVRFQLPLNPPLKFFFFGDIPNSLKSALSSIGTSTDSPQGAIVVARQGANLPAGMTGSIELVNGGPALTDGALITIANNTSSLTKNMDFEGAKIYTDTQMPAGSSPVLLARGVACASLTNDASGKHLYLGDSLVEDNSDLPRRAAFPVLMYQLAIRLAGWKSTLPVVPSLRQIEDPLWQKPVTNESALIAISQPPERNLTNTSGKPSEILSNSVSNSNWPWTQLLISAGLLFLIAEGLLLAGKKII